MSEIREGSVILGRVPFIQRFSKRGMKCGVKVVQFLEKDCSIARQLVNQGIAWLYAQPFADRLGDRDLAFAGDFGRSNQKEVR